MAFGSQRSRNFMKNTSRVSTRFGKDCPTCRRHRTNDLLPTLDFIFPLFRREQASELRILRGIAMTGLVPVLFFQTAALCWLFVRRELSHVLWDGIREIGQRRIFHHLPSN